MEIKIFKDIHNRELKEAWIRLGEESDVFPQMYYEWIEPWWRLRVEGKKLHVIVLYDENRAIAIAPFCLEKRLGITVLASIPIHYGDKFEIIIDGAYSQREILQIMFKHISKFQDFNFVKITNVQKESELYYFLKSINYRDKYLIGCPLSDFSNINFDTYLKRIDGKVRSDYRRRQRRLEELGSLSFEVSQDPEFYKHNQSLFREIYERRWQNVDTKLPDELVYRCREEAYTACLEKKKALMAILRLDGRIIGYRIGFLHQQCYYDWKICFDVDFAKFGLGSIMTGKLIEILIPMGFSMINHGAGDYSYKRDWTLDNRVKPNYEFFASSNSPLANIYLLYRVKYREMLKTYYHKYYKKGRK